MSRAQPTLDLPTVVLDFETYYDRDYSLRKMSIPAYVADPRFKVHGLAVERDGKAEFLPEPEVRTALSGLTGHAVICHNAMFDCLILKDHYDFVPKFIMDTLFMANHVLGPAKDSGIGNSLEKLADRLGIEAKGSLDFMEGVADPDPEQRRHLAEYATGDVRITRQVFDALLRQVSRPEFELWLADHTVRTFITKPLCVDADRVEQAQTTVRQRLAEKVEPVCGQKVKMAVVKKGKKGRKTMPDEPDQTVEENVEVTESLLSSGKQFGCLLAAVLKSKGLSVPTKAGKNGTITALGKLDPGFLALRVSDDPDVAALVEARLAKMSSNQLLARLETLQQYAELGGLRAHLVYYGAHTGRFSGGGGFNLQNLPAASRATTQDERELALAVRRCIVATEGMTFVSVDASQIEARVLAWLAGQQNMIDAFAAGRDLYCEFISNVLGEEIRKPTADDAPDEAHHLRTMRHVGKASILGLGYGMGTDTFITRLRANTDVAPLIGDTLPVSTLKKCVATYRKQYDCIPTFWKRLENAFHLARRGNSQQMGRLAMLTGESDASVRIVLPSGREIHYDNITHAWDMKRCGWQFGNSRSVYGGLLCENVTQAVARDVLAEGVFATVMLGYPVVLHVHDSIICQVPHDEAEECHRRVVQVLSTPPMWMDGCPLAAEEAVGENLSFSENTTSGNSIEHRVTPTAAPPVVSKQERSTKTPKLQLPLKWHGGKHYLAARIVALMPPHLHYVEPFFGGGSVLLNKSPDGVSEVVNDLDGDLTNYWCVLQDEETFGRFVRIIQATPFSEAEWRKAQEELPTGSDPVDRATRFYVHCRQSLAGRRDGFASISRNRVRRSMNEQVSAWLTAIDGLEDVHARLSRVVILNRPALDVIRKEDSPKTLFYLDPPYLPETRRSPDTYGRFEMTLADHEKLLQLLLTVQGNVILSGYPSELYDTVLRGWHHHDFNLPNNAAGGDAKRRMIERVWMNYDPTSCGAEVAMASTD